MLNDAIGAATHNTNYFWSNKIKSRRRSFRMAATEPESDEGDEESKKIAKRKVEAEAKQASAEAEAKRLKAEAEKAAKLKAEQDEKLKEAQEMLALLQKEAEARKKAEEDTVKQQAEAEKKRKQAEEEAAKIKAEVEAEEKRKKLKAQKKAEDEAARKKAEAEEKRKQEEKEEKERLKAKEKADELATLLKAKEEAARVMAEIDAKLQAQTAEADKEEAERVEKLQSDAEQMPDLDDESDEMLKKMMEEMEKVRIELDSRLEAEAKEVAAKAEEEAEAKKAEEEATAAKAKAEEQAKTNASAKAEDEKEADLMDRIKSGANFDPVSKTVTPEEVDEIPQPSSSKSKTDPIDTTATTPPKPKPMPDLSSSSNGKPEAKKIDKDGAKPKWMVDWKKDESKESKPKSSTNYEAAKEEEEVKGDEKMEEKVEEENESSDPRTTGRSRKENLFDVIGRTASGGITMDEITEMKKKAKETPPAPTPEVLNELKKKGPPDSFGQSVAASYRTGSKDKEDSGRVMPDLQNMKELKKKGPPASFGSYAAAASSAGSPTNNSGDETIDSMDKGPPASFGASVAMASSGEVPKDLLSRGTASTDASAPPKTKTSTSRKRSDNNIIDVVDVEYTKKDSVSKPKEEDKEKAPPSPPMGSAPPLEVEKTVPQTPPLQVEKIVPPMQNPPKKTESTETVAEDTSTSSTNPIKNIGKAAVEKVFGQKKNEVEEDTKQTPVKDDKKEDGGKGMAMEDRVAQLLKEAFSLSKEDSRVADLLQGVVSITTGKEDKKNKKKSSAKKISSKGRKTTRQVAEEEEIDDDEEDDDIEEDFDEDEDDYDDDYDDDYEDDEDDFEEEEDEDEEEDSTIMGSGRRVEDTNGFGRNANRRAPPNRGVGNSRFMEDTRRPSRFGDVGNDGYFVDDEDDYFTYDENDRWQGRGPGSGRREPPMQSGGYSVRPPPQSRGDSLSDSDDDYYFLQFGSPSSRYDEPRGGRYYDDQDDYYYDDDYDGAQPGAPRPAYNEPEDEAPKGPPASFGNFVADASMAKTGYAPSTLKDDKFGGSGINGGGGGRGAPGEEFGEEMSQSTGGMLSPRTNRVNGSGGNTSGKGRSAQPHFVVSEDQNDSGNKKGPPAGFGKSVAEAGEQQMGYPMRSVEEEIANGGMATPTGSMAMPRRKTPSNPSTPPNGSGKKKPLFIVSEEEAGPADFGSSVAEASGSKTGWAPKTPKRATGGLEGGTTGGMRPKLKKRETPQSSAPKQKEFGDTVFEDCPPLDSKKKKSKGELPLTRKQSLDTDMNQKHQRNPAVNLVDGGASKAPKRPVQYSGSMMAPRIRRKAPPAQESAPPPVEGNNLEEEDTKE